MGKQFPTPCSAFASAVDGDTVEIDGSGGAYTGDVCGIYPNKLTIRGVNGRPKIDAGGLNSMGKGTWVVIGAGTVVDNVEMFGAKVTDKNGAAIRLDGRDLTMRNNIFAGVGTVSTQASAINKTNYQSQNPAFVDRVNYDLHPAPGSPMIDAGSALGTSVEGAALMPVSQCKHVAGIETRPVAGTIDIGAYEAASTTGTTTTSTGTTTSTTMGATTTTTASTTTTTAATTIARRHLPCASVRLPMAQ